MSNILMSNEPPCHNPRHLATIPYNTVYVHFVDFHYDIDISGLCSYNGKLCRFYNDWDIFVEDEDGDRVYLTCIHTLSFFQKLRLLFRKRLFEWCVGYHWTYKNGKRVASYVPPRTLWQKCKHRAYYGSIKLKHRFLG